MKKTYQVVIFVILLSTTFSIFSNSAITCPSSSTIKLLDFKEAFPFSMDPKGWIWVSLTNSFSHDNVMWNVAVGGRLQVNEMNLERAMAAAKKMLIDTPLIDNPKPYIDESDIECVYYHQDGFEIVAFSPPAAMELQDK